MARTPTLYLQGWHSINKCERFLRVTAVGSGQVDDKRDSACVTNKMTLAAQLGAIGRIRSCLRPPKLLVPNNCPHQPSTSRFGSSGTANLTMQNRSSSKCRRPANHASVSSRSCLNRTPAPWVASPKEYHCEEQTRCLSCKLDPVHVAVHLLGWVSLAIKKAQSSPTNC